MNSPAPPADTTSTSDGSANTPRLRKELGFWSLTAIGFSGIMGSGWLFGAQYAAQAAGPASLLSWLVGGAAFTLIALVLIELGASRPVAGGIVRWPFLSNGPLTAGIVGWSVLLATSSATAAEASAITQYASHYLPWLYEDGALTAPGLVLSAGLLALVMLLNWFGVRLFARVNFVLTAIKFGVPVITLAALLASGFSQGGDPVAAGGGFAPYGWTAALSAVATAGIIYTINGFAPTIDLAAEARDPRRDIPRAVLTAIGLAVLLYLGLQVAFLYAVPESALAGGWHGIDFSSPFGELALLLNLGWLAALLYADAVISPGGALLVGIAGNSRVTYAMARNGVLPKRVTEVHAGSGVPRAALLVNFTLALILLAPFDGWQDIIGVAGNLFLLNYSVAAVSAAAFRRARPDAVSGWVPGMRWITPLSFVVSAEIIYWSQWEKLSVVLPLAVLAVPLFALITKYRGVFFAQLRQSAWLVTYLVVLFAISALGGFGGTELIPAPLDSALVAVVALLIYFWGARSGERHLANSAVDTDEQETTD
ncbi:MULTISPECIES: APC family permease [unclassified Saccharopolyspora]|uniref:APC family permease n=1 Tax=unclassified Saccharopolyspora TaxID=2646250 RepID=UPI001CD64FEC|nr:MULTISPECIES: APC family permease [unclassified Saccharopolyspora]MCA1186752.1 APC family permease [Saccharopolyspora sp. 6T]MCA1192996.1 APC family permease [Saccharopolyspora sp. 6V]MCA1282009.1 APC family permease [Saccharopolyspora sp. 7B]